MERYVEQLLGDIACATEDVDVPYAFQECSIHDWIPDEEENRSAPRRMLEEWRRIRQARLPPDDRLTDEQLHRILDALKSMLDAYNWSFVLQIQVPERVQYQAIRDNFNQEAVVKQWHMGFFKLCRPGTPHGKCALRKFCQCKFYAELFANFEDDDLTPEEERARALEIEVDHLQKKYGRDWKKYYPYHLDPEYDDENGNPSDYGVGKESDVDDDDWWKH
jgi:hypothetical protein